MDAVEASLISGLEVIPVNSVAELVAYLTGETEIIPHPPVLMTTTHAWTQTIFREVKGQEHVK